jgi:hypothetical protein
MDFHDDVEGIIGHGVQLRASVRTFTRRFSATQATRDLLDAHHAVVREARCRGHEHSPHTRVDEAQRTVVHDVVELAVLPEELTT